MTRDRREISTVIGVIALGGLLVLLTSGRPWLTLTANRPAPFGPLAAHVSGRTEFGALAGFALVILLGAALLLVSGRLVRAVLALLVIATAAGAGWYGVRGLSAPGQNRATELLGGADKTQHASVAVSLTVGWPAVAIVGAALAMAGGVLVLLRARRWPGGLSARYEAPTSAPTGAPIGSPTGSPTSAPTDTPAEAAPADDPWRALDRGEDPTISDR